jgi:uncharacterized protein (DUF697 family)
MLRAIKQARSALSMLNPQEVRARAEQPVNIGLVAASESCYNRMEQLLTPAQSQSRLVFRSDSPDAPRQVDLVFYEPALNIGGESYPLDVEDPDAVFHRVIRDHDEFALSLARQFPVFRDSVVDRIIHSVARENATFAMATALPDVIPNFMELPWALGEWASDTAFITANQVRMAFLIAAACGKDIGFAEQKLEILGIGAGAFGWRAIARELVGKIPLGGGLIPKGAIAWAGTFVMGKGLERIHSGRAPLTRGERESAYQQALESGKTAANSLL